MFGFYIVKLGFLAVTLSIVSVSFVSHADERRITIHEALDLALSQNYLLAAEQAGVAAARAEALRAERHAWPSVTAYGSIARSDSPLQAFGARLEQESIVASDFEPARLNDPDAVTNFQMRLEISAPLYMGGAITAARQKAHALADAAAVARQAMEQKIVFEVIMAYNGVLQAEAQIGAAQKALQAARNHQRATQLLLEKGMVMQSDLMDSEVHLLDTEVALSRAENEKARAVDRLRDLLGVDFDTLLVTKPFELALDIEDIALDEWLQAAVTNRPDLLSMQSRLKASQQELVERRSLFRPKVMFKAVQAWNSDSVALENSNTTIAGVVEWNLFSGGADKAALDVANAHNSRLRYQLLERQQRIRSELMDALRRLSEAIYTRQARKEALRQAEEVLRIRSLRHDQGLESTTDLLMSQAQLDSVRLEFIRSDFGVTLSQAALLLAAGRLTQEVIK